MEGENQDFGTYLQNNMEQEPSQIIANDLPPLPHKQFPQPYD